MTFIIQRFTRATPTVKRIWVFSQLKILIKTFID